MRRLLSILALAALTAAGCGGDGGDDTTSATATTEGTATQPQSGGQGASAEGGGGAARNGGSSPDTLPNPGYKPEIADPTPGAEEAARGVPTSRGGDNSIQRWGTESERSELEQAANSLQDFLNARVTGDRARICANVSDKLKRDLFGQVGAEGEGKSCAQLLRFAFRPAPEATRRDARDITVLSFRSDGEVGFVIYRDVAGDVLAYPMHRTDGEWKVSLLGPTPLG